MSKLNALFLLYFFLSTMKPITDDVVKARLDLFVAEVHAKDRHTALKPGRSWWVLKANNYKKLRPGNAVCLERQLGFTAEQMQEALGRKWRSKILGLSKYLYVWPGGKYGMEYVCVLGADTDPQEPDENKNIVASVLPSLKSKLQEEHPIANSPQPSAMIRRQTAEAAEKLSQSQASELQKNIQDGAMTAEQYEDALKLLKSGKLKPNEIMKKTAVAVLLGAKKRNGIATISVPRMVGKNGNTVYTDTKVLVLPSEEVTVESGKSTKWRASMVVKTLIDELFGSTAAKVDCFKKISRGLGISVVDRVQQLSISEVLAFRRYARLSNRQTSKIGRFLRQRKIVQSLLPNMQSDHLEYHVRPFMTKYGFYGRGSEEGKEQAHNEYSADMGIVGRLKCKATRVSSFLRRQNTSASPEIATILQSLDPKKRGNGRYNPSNKRQCRRIEKVYANPTRDAGNEYLEVEDTKVDGTFLIKKSWKKVYMMCAYGEVPEEWTL